MSETTFTCDYCAGVGACPKCWGRAAIEELKRDRDRWREACLTSLQGDYKKVGELVGRGQR